MPNGGLQVVNPCAAIYDRILHQLTNDSAIQSYEFADQSMLGDIFFDRWHTLPYIYNGLKTLRWDNVHAPIWRDDRVKNIHYIFSPKPWEEDEGEAGDPTHAWWFTANRERLGDEKKRGINDGF